jgi:hypothetical protein
LSVAETLLIFAGSPIAIAALVYGLVYGAGGRRVNKRYRPGRPFQFAPVWFVAAPAASGAASGTAAALTGGAPRHALTATENGALAETQAGETGGASDRW